MNDKGHILIIDDDPKNHFLLEQWLQADGYRTTAVLEGPAGLEVLRRQHVHLVISDLMMPEMDGRAVLKAIKSSYPDMEVIMVSGTPTVELAVAAMREGAYDFIQKPLRREELLALVEKALEKTKLKNIISVYRSGQDVFKTMSLDTLLPITIRLAAEALGADDASIMLLNGENMLEVAAAHGLNDDERMKVRVALGDRVAGKVFETQEPVLIPGALDHDPRFKDVPVLRAVHSAIVYPLVVDGVALGVLNVNRTARKELYTASDLAAAQVVCAQIARAILNARMFLAVKDDQLTLSMVLNQINDPIFLVDPSGSILLCNDISRKYFGADLRPGMSLFQRLSGLKIEPQLRQVMASAQTVVHLDATRKSPKLLILSGTATCVPLEAFGLKSGAMGKLVVLKDVTQEKSINQQKYTFLALISHKFRTPLTSIIGYAELLMQEAGLSKDAIRFTQSTLRQSQKLADLMEKLLRFIDLEELEAREPSAQPFEVEETVSGVIEQLGPWLKKYGATASMKVDSEVALGSVGLIRDVLQNLIENAVKFNPKPDKRVWVSAEAKGDEIEVSVRDNGDGIAPEDQEKILGGFYQSEKIFTGQVEGLGLGLAFVKRVIRHHGGKVRLQSAAGSGSTIFFTLPRQKGKA